MNKTLMSHKNLFAYYQNMLNRKREERRRLEDDIASTLRLTQKYGRFIKHWEDKEKGNTE